MAFRGIQSGTPQARSKVAEELGRGVGKALTELEELHMIQEEAKAKVSALCVALEHLLLYRSRRQTSKVLQKWFARYFRSKKLDGRVAERRQAKKGAKGQRSESRSRSPTRPGKGERVLRHRATLRDLN